MYYFYADIFYDKDDKNLKNQKIKGIVILSLSLEKVLKKISKSLKDLETFKNNKNQLVEIGNRTNSYKNIGGQYMGVFKIDPISWGKIKQHLFKDIKDLNKIDITALFQLILKKNICNIYVKNYKKKWFEIDNINDNNLLKKSKRI